MTLPGYGFERRSFLTKENVGGGAWLWHVNFYSVPDIPEPLISGRGREYFSYFIKNQTRNPHSISLSLFFTGLVSVLKPGILRETASVSFGRPISRCSYAIDLTNLEPPPERGEPYERLLVGSSGEG